MTRKTDMDANRSTNRSADLEANPFIIPQPYFLPGYTGHCPNYSEVIGTSYGRATHTIMGNFRTAPDRLKERSSDTVQQDLQLLDDRRCQGNKFLTKDISAGYQGHIPRASEQVGMTFNQQCVKGVAEFERRNRRHEKFLKSAADHRRQG